jgi:hypothetical protein
MAGASWMRYVTVWPIATPLTWATCCPLIEAPMVVMFRFPALTRVKVNVLYGALEFRDERL